MTLFEQLQVHILKPVAVEWKDPEDFDEADNAFDEEEICAILEAVVYRYLQRHRLLRQLVAGVTVATWGEGKGPSPFLTKTLHLSARGLVGDGRGNLVVLEGAGAEELDDAS